MNELEQNQLDTLRPLLRRGIEAAEGDNWIRRRDTAAQLLERINGAWWCVYAQNPDGYSSDLDRLNRAAGWDGEHSQTGEWHCAAGRDFLMPPKFFGGDPRSLDENFVASMSLNHAVLPSGNAAFKDELTEQQSAEAAFDAHCNYFSRSYAYAPFFRARAQVLRAFAQARKLPDIPPQADWQELNRRYAFYLELFPTRSRRFRPLPLGWDYHELRTASFVMALNAAVHDVVLRVLRPGSVLLAGKNTWTAWPDDDLAPRGSDVGRLVRASARPCPVYMTYAWSALSTRHVRVVRTNFLRTVYGPNSDAELRKLGKDVLGAEAVDQ